jgi:cell division protein FtsI/penicillin-binding protein 2
VKNNRLGQIVFGFLLLLALMVGRLFQLQITEAKEWQRQARSSRLDKDTIPFKRGRILTADGSVIAEDDSVYDLYFRYRDFRRHHIAGQLHAVLGLLGVEPPSVVDCMNDSLYWGQELLRLRPSQIDELVARDRQDLNFYLQIMFGLDDSVGRAEYSAWLDSPDESLNDYFSNAGAEYAKRVDFFTYRIKAIEKMLGADWHQQLMHKIEKRRQQLQLMVLQRSLQDAAARALGLSSSELRGRLRDSESRSSAAHFLHQHWQLDGRAEYLAAMLITVDDAASEQLLQRELSQQVELLTSLWKQISISSPNDTSGIFRDQQYRVHRFRVISFAKDIDFDLIDLLAQQRDDYPGLYLQKSTRRNFPVELNPQIVGMVRLPQARDLDEYRSLSDSFRQLRKLFYRTAEDEAEYRQLRHKLWSATLRPDETRGITGVEHAFEQVLRGVRGYLQVLEGGDEGKAPLELLYSPPQNGNDVMLSLDLDLINIAEQSIIKVYKETPSRLRQLFPSAELSSSFNSREPKVGFALIDLQKYGVPMLATTPLLNRYQLRNDYQQLATMKDASPLRHRALAGNYWPQETPYPGSTFKPLVAAAALMLDTSYWNKSYNCQGTFQANEQGANLSCDTRYGHQQITMRDALKKSCNIYFYKLARDIGARAIHDLATSLGFGTNTGFEVTELEKGANYLVDLETMQNNSLRLMRTAIGQVGVQASPLQMARFYGWLATSSLPGGNIVLQGAGGSPAVAPNTEIDFADSQRAKITDALSAVNYELGGTAFKTEFPREWQVVGKTGTSQVSLGGTMQPTHAWFAGYFPAENPRYAFAIMCENTGMHGGQIASFILKDFLEQAMPQLISRKNVR